MRVEKRRFKLEGEVNPWVLLASGEIKHLEADDARIKNKLVGEKVDMGEGVEGILIGRKDIKVPKGAKGIDDSAYTGSKYVDDLNLDEAKAIDEFDELSQLDDAGRGDRIRGGAKSERVSLRKEVRDKIYKNADSGEVDANGYTIYLDGKTGRPIPNYGTHYPDKTPLGHPHPKAGQPVPPNLVGKPRADIGHANNNAWKNRLQDHKENNRSRAEIIKTENDPDLYVLEERSSNRSRKQD